MRSAKWNKANFATTRGACNDDMAYELFKPKVWSKYIEKQLGKFTTFEDDCNYKFKGEVGKGKTVKILGVTRPTIGDYNGTEIAGPEYFDGVEQELKIDQKKYFNFMIDDVDEAQCMEGVMEAYIEEASKAMAECRDSYIAELIATNADEDMVSETYTLATMDKTAVKKAIDAGIQKLWENGVSQKDDVTIYLNPEMYLLFQEYITETKSDNDKAIASGILGNYAGAKVKMSNNFYNKDGVEYLFIKTGKAVAFASGIDETEAYRPEGLFSDAIKGLNTYGGKVIRPRELYIMKVA